MKHKILSQIFLLTSVLVIAVLNIHCSNSSESSSEYSFKMYFLSNDNLSYLDVENVPLNKLVLKYSPFLTHEDIRTYMVYNNLRRIILKDSTNEDFSTDIRPFVLVVNGKRFCLGEYWQSFMSIMPKGIFMYKANASEYCLYSRGANGSAKLNDTTIVSTLQKLGVEIKYVKLGAD